MNIVAHNRMETLCQKLSENLNKKDIHIFARHTLITQTAGINAWLKTELAERNGVVSHVDFINQDGLFNEVYRLFMGELLLNAFDKNKYVLFRLLNEQEFIVKYADVASYYHDNKKRRFDLATKIADLFDQYQLYRPDMIDNWTNDAFSINEPSFTEKWQQWLWKKLYIPSKSSIKAQLIQYLESLETQEKLRERFPVISLFGLSVVTPFHWDFISELSKHTTVNVYVCLPTGTTDFKNVLLKSFGAKMKELVTILEIKNVIVKDFEPTTSLSTLQQAVYQNNPERIEMLDDDSIQINSCYTPIREVECLYNYLLNQFETDKTLRPRDILVMANDIDKYSPFIKAVFRNAPLAIPIRVSGTLATNSHSIIATLEQLIVFKKESLTSERVISLLEEVRIKNQYQVSDCNYLRAVVQKVNIRFGEKNNTEDESQYVSWEYGLDKLILGYAMLTDQEFEGKLPYRDAEASASYDLFRLKAFYDDLVCLLQIQTEDHTLVEWKRLLFEQVIDKMILRDDFNKVDRDELSSIYKALSFIDRLDMDEKVPFTLFLSELKSKLFSQLGEIKLNSGCITVSSAIPVRGIPYKIVCMLGLNNDNFPRQDRFMGFDLLTENYQAGDRSKKEADKLLFLDTLLSAREKIYFSYIGQNVKDNNSEIPPSIVLDIIMSYTGLKEVKHPLHGFSPKYQAKNKHLFTYLYGNRPIDFQPKVKEIPVLSEISIKSFTKFFAHPAEWYFKTVLEIYYDDNDCSLPETELFDLNGLEGWIVKEDLVKHADLTNYLDKAKKEGKLPLKNMGQVKFEDYLEEVSCLKSKYEELIDKKTAQPTMIDFTVNGVRIYGTIDRIFGRSYIDYSVSKHSLKYKVAAYLQALLLYIDENIDDATFIDLEGNVTQLPYHTASEAVEKIEQLIDYVKNGYLTPLKFTLDSASIAKDEKKTYEHVKDKIIKDAYGNSYNSISADPYLSILFKEGYYDHFDEEDRSKIAELAQLLNI